MYEHLDPLSEQGVQKAVDPCEVVNYVRGYIQWGYTRSITVAKTVFVRDDLIETEGHKLFSLVEILPIDELGAGKKGDVPEVIWMTMGDNDHLNHSWVKTSNGQT